MIKKIISLIDGEEDCMMQVSLDTDYSGVCWYTVEIKINERVARVFDESLLKQLCNDLSKIIKKKKRIEQLSPT